MKTKLLTVGLHLGDPRHTACVLDETGEILAEEAFANTLAELEVLSGRFHRNSR